MLFLKNCKETILLCMKKYMCLCVQYVLSFVYIYVHVLSSVTVPFFVTELLLGSPLLFCHSFVTLLMQMHLFINYFLLIFFVSVIFYSLIE